MKLWIMSGLFVAVLVIYAVFCVNVKKNIPNITEYRLSSSKVLDDDERQDILDQNDILRLRESLKGYNVTAYYCSGEYLYTIDEKKLPVTVIYADESYKSVYGLEMKEGGFFDSLDDSALKPVIIGEGLAGKLFMTDNVIGITVNIGGERYKITGIYKNDLSFAGRIAEGNRYRVYVPNTALYNFGEQMPAEVIAVTNSNGYDVPASGISQKTKSKLLIYDKINYGELEQAMFLNTSFVVPEGFIPEGNLFDFRFYYDEFVELFVLLQRTAYNDGGYLLGYINICFIIVIIFHVALVILLINCIIFSVKIKKKYKSICS